MKLSEFKDKIDAYFDALSPDELIQRFELLGYEFEVVPNEYEIYALDFEGSTFDENFSINQFLSKCEMQKLWGNHSNDNGDVVFEATNPVSEEGEFLSNRQHAMAA